MTPEARLVLLASRLAPNAAAMGELRELINAGVDWPAVLTLAIPHGTLPLMARSAGDLVSPSLARQMSSYAYRIKARSEHAETQLLELLQIFAPRKITVVPFKGAVLQAAVYAGLPLREFADIDLMVKRADVPQAAEAMQASGYTLANNQRAIPDLMRQGDALEFTRDHSLPVDLHWCFSNRGFDFNLNPDALWQELQPVQIGGTSVPCYSPETTLLILCAHQAKHRWRRLNWICDIAAFTQTHYSIDWGNALKRARDVRCERLVLATLGLAETLLGAALPDAVHARLAEDPGARALIDRLAPDILGGSHKTRGLYISMREGNRVAACGHYLASKLRFRLAGFKTPLSTQTGSPAGYSESST
jgi:hypothetical protein